MVMAALTVLKSTNDDLGMVLLQLGFQGTRWFKKLNRYLETILQVLPELPLDGKICRFRQVPFLLQQAADFTVACLPNLREEITGLLQSVLVGEEKQPMTAFQS